MKTKYSIDGESKKLTGLSKVELFNELVSFTDELSNLVNEMNQYRIEVVGVYLYHGDIALAMCEDTLIEYTKTVCETMTQQLEEELFKNNNEFKFYNYNVTIVK